MTPNDQIVLSEAIQVLADHHPRQDVPVSTIKAYVGSLSDLPMAAVLPALERCAKTIRFFPSVAEIREEIGAVANNAELIAETAWVEVERQIRICGATKTQTFYGGEFHESPDPEFSTDLIGRVVESIGWRNLCLEPQSKMRLDFIFAYRSLFTAAVSRIQRGTIVTGEPLPANVSSMKEIAS
jgi:hypothetical protein